MNTEQRERINALSKRLAEEFRASRKIALEIAEVVSRQSGSTAKLMFAIDIVRHVLVKQHPLPPNYDELFAVLVEKSQEFNDGQNETSNGAATHD